MRGMETGIHARFQPQRRIGAVATALDQTRVKQQILQRVRKALGLEQRGAADFAAGADDRVARADQNVRAALDWADAILEFANKHVVQAFQLLLLALPHTHPPPYPPP